LLVNFCGAKTLSITTFSITTFSILTFIITALSIMGLFATLYMNDTPYHHSTITLYYYAECHAECHYAECHYAECHYAECHYAECHFAKCHFAKCRGAIFSRFWEQQIFDRQNPLFFRFVGATTFDLKVICSNAHLLVISFKAEPTLDI
jgi:hypothetical protein